MNRTIIWKAVWLSICALLASTSAQATLKPAAIFTDNAVLQRGIDLPVWGTATNGRRITVKFNGQERSAACVNGKWMVRFKPMSAELKNILLGEVWLCGGQSNMQWPLAETENADQSLANSSDENLRLYTVPLATAPAPAPDLPGGRWDPCSPDTARGFSAVAYHFGRELRKALGRAAVGAEL